ncbi:MAG: prepilin-type N-terminal cleavage/methylation domain-containing protein [Planctomycetes bacterium]|nr:prepilin-type N-terminal cleavage/methylation domain-containing protein [Planctomycetota bacterium]
MNPIAIRSAPRRGITLMEVLISIGILAVGLTSVVALVPAGRSQASRGIIYDRATTMATNALADAVTAGFTRLDSLTPVSEDYNGDGALDPASGEWDVNGNNTADQYLSLSEDFALDGATAADDRDGNGAVQNFGVVVCDPLGPMYTEGPFPAVVARPVLHVGLKQRGLLAPGGAARWTLPAPGVGGAATRMALLAQGRDDLRFNLSGAGADDPPLNLIDSGGVRSFEGRTTCMFALARIDTGVYTLTNVPVSPPLVAGELAKLSVVVFHGRSGALEDALVPATYDPAAGALTVATANLPSGRTIKDILKPGVVIYDGRKVHAANLWNTATGVQATGAQHERFSQVTMASVETAAAGATSHTVFVTLAGPAPTAGAVQILVDSVGLAEQTVVLEGAGAYGR